MKRIFLIVCILSLGAFASAETVTRKDDNTATVQRTIVIEKTHEQMKAELEAALREKAAVEHRLSGINETIATLEKRLADAEKAGVKAKPAEDAKAEE
jgi:predicted  nucleic acid-binding Zn-ribbon protein